MVTTISNSIYACYTGAIMVGFKGYKTDKGDIPKFTEYNGMIEFSIALRKYYEVSTPESREEIYRPWLSDNVIDTRGQWYKGHKVLRKEENIVKDVVYVLAKTLHEELNQPMKKSRKHLSGPQRFEEDSVDTVLNTSLHNSPKTVTKTVTRKKDKLDDLIDSMKLEKRMMRIMMLCTAVLGSTLLYFVIYKL